MKKSTQHFLDAIVQETNIFLKEDMLLDIVEVSLETNSALRSHCSFIELEGVGKVIVAIAIQDSLFDILFNTFFKDGVSVDEKDELIEALPHEIINTVVGLAIRRFPKEYAGLELGIPVGVDENIDFENIHSAEATIKTSVGDFVCKVSAE
ncbi:MAG: hypothetical protein U9N30_01445 [Campylobacterota bacterium]|nr:hypothetical protein [Campylobacterota bacterium]